MFAVPLYFQIAMDATTFNAGAHLVPAVIGNAAGGLVCGVVIKK
jgi:formate/nitrite transporter FocA (FNT family)